MNHQSGMHNEADVLRKSNSGINFNVMLRCTINGEVLMVNAI